MYTLKTKYPANMIQLATDILLLNFFQTVEGQKFRNSATKLFRAYITGTPEVCS